MPIVLTAEQAFDVATRNTPSVVTGDVPLAIRVKTWTQDGFNHLPANPTDAVGATFLSAMRDAATNCLERLNGCSLAYQMDGEINLLFLASDERRETATTSLAATAASVATASFNRARSRLVERCLDDPSTTDADREKLASVADADVTFSAVALVVAERDVVSYLVTRQRAISDEMTKRVWRGTPKLDAHDENVFDNTELMRHRMRAAYGTNLDDWPACVTRGFVAARRPSGAVIIDATPPDFHEHPNYVLLLVTDELPTYRNCSLGELTEATEADDRRVPLETMSTRIVRILHSRYVDAARDDENRTADHRAHAAHTRAAARRDELARELARRGVRVDENA